jgi:soluble lytic murein transglycosylase
MTSTFRATALLLLLLATMGLPGRVTMAAPAEPEAVRQAFMDALATVQAAPMRPSSDAERDLRGYVLYPYLEAARLRRQLELATPAAGQLIDPLLPVDDDVVAFLREHGSAPVTDRLRTAWLDSLAARRAWSAYLEHFDPERDATVALRCHALVARVRLGRTSGLADALAQTWLVPRSLPDACDPALEWWKARGGPGVELAARRAELALEAGDPALARYVVRSFLPGARGAPLLQWAALIERPAAEIAAVLATPGRVVDEAALRDGWTRFARADAEAAAREFPALVAGRQLDARAASPYALAVALGLAWGRLPGALEFFARVHPDDFDERGHEWHARAALWARDWARAAAAVAAMPDALRNQARWQYWAARAHEQTGEFASARAGYAQVSTTDNWYAALAAARLDRKFTPTLQPLALADAAIDELAQSPGLLRARELLSCRLEAEAGAEWRAAVDALPPGQQRVAVGLAARWGWHHQAIAAAARLKLFNDYELLYPRPYEFDVREASRRTGLSREFIYAIIRQESLFRPDAGSSAGALGLMQLLPGTARLVARRNGVRAPTRAQLLEPSVNIALGADYLAGMLQRFDGEPALASAAYNAGPNAARRWLPPAPLDLDVWAENIPYNETRAYVQRVAWHALVFDWLREREPRDVSHWLRSVKPVATATASSAG